MGCSVSLPSQPLLKRRRYKDTGAEISSEAMKEEKELLYHGALVSPLLPNKEIPDFVVKKKVKKIKESNPVTFAQEFFYEQNSARRRKQGGRLTFNGDLNSLPIQFCRLGPSFHKQIQIQIKEFRDKAQVGKSEKNIITKQALKLSPDPRKVRKGLQPNGYFGGSIQDNYKHRWMVKPLQEKQNPSLASINTHQGSFKHNLTFSPKASEDTKPEADLSHHLPYMSIEAKLITEISGRCNSEPRTKKEFLEIEKIKKLRRAKKQTQNLQSVEKIDIPNFCNPEIKLQEVLKQKLKNKLSIHELQARSHLNTVAGMILPQKKKFVLSQSGTEALKFEAFKEGLTTANQSLPKKLPIFRQSTSAPVIEALVADAAKRSTWQRRNHSQFKVVKEREDYKRFLGFLRGGDRKKATRIMSPNQTFNFSFTNDEGIIRSSLKRKPQQGKLPETLETSICNQSSSRRLSLPTIVETEKESHQSRQVDSSLRKNSFSSSLMFDKLTPNPIRRQKSIFSIERMGLLLKSAPGTPQYVPYRRSKFALEPETPWI